MHWVLIIMIWSQYGTAVTTQEFFTEHQCKKAQTWVKDHAANPGFINTECFFK